jgi:hypothetical protein
MMGFAWGAGALMTPLVGMFSERFGFTRALVMMSVVPLVSAALLWFYPRDERRVLLSPKEALATGD